MRMQGWHPATLAVKGIIPIERCERPCQLVATWATGEPIKRRSKSKWVLGGQTPRTLRIGGLLFGTHSRVVDFMLHCDEIAPLNGSTTLANGQVLESWSTE